MTTLSKMVHYQVKCGFPDGQKDEILKKSALAQIERAHSFFLGGKLGTSDELSIAVDDVLNAVPGVIVEIYERKGDVDLQQCLEPHSYRDSTGTPSCPRCTAA